MQPLIKKVVKRPAQNRFVLRTAARGASFFAKATRRVFFAMKKSKAGLGCNPKNFHISLKAGQKGLNLENGLPINANGEQNVILFPAH